MKGIQVLSYLKLRASYGLTGNDRIQDYGYLDTYTVGNFRGELSLTPTQHYNPEFAWEVNKKADFELESRYLDDRLYLSINWFRNVSGNQLVGYPLPDITGFPTILSNFPAVVENKGWEVYLKYRSKQQNQILKWDIGFNLTIPRNTLLEYPDLESSTYSNTYVVGKSLYIRKLYEYMGIDEGGLYTIRDFNEDGRLSTADRHLIKDTQRNFYVGLTSTWTYKRLSLGWVIEGVSHKGPGGYLSLTGLFPGGMVNQPMYALDRWRKPGDQSRVQRATTSSTNYQNMVSSDYNFVDASYLRIKNIHLAYSFNQSGFFGNGIKSLEVYMTAQNFFTLSSYPGWDPSSPGIQRLPTLKTWIAGLRMGI